jgi:hypothetical protein
MGTPKGVVSSNRDGSNAQVIDRPSDKPVKERYSDVRCVLCVLCGGNFHANYTGSSVYRELQRKHPPLRVKQYTHPTGIKRTPQTQPGILYAQIGKQNSYALTYVEQETHKSKSSANQ